MQVRDNGLDAECDGDVSNMNEGNTTRYIVDGGLHGTSSQLMSL